MELHVFTADYERIGILGTFTSLTWEEHYQQKGRFILHTIATDDNVKLLRIGNRLWQRGKKTSMIIYFVKIEGNRIEVYGFTALVRLEQRIIIPTAYVTNVERGMKDIVINNSRELGNLCADEMQGFIERHESQYTGNQILEALEILGLESGLGFYMKFDPVAKKDIFTVYRGVDYTVGENVRILSAEFRTLDNLNIVEDISIYKNVAYVAGSGEGDNRTIIIVGDKTGSERRELWVDARDIHQDTFVQQMLDRHLQSLERLSDREGGEFSAFQLENLQSQIDDFNDVSIENGVDGILSYNVGAMRFSPTISQMRRNIYARIDFINKETNDEYVAQLHQRGIERLNEREYIHNFVAKVSGDIGAVGDVIICRGREITLTARVMIKREITENNTTTTECVIGTPEITVFDEMRKTSK